MADTSALKDPLKTTGDVISHFNPMRDTSNTSLDSSHKPKDLAFWLVFFSLCVSSFLSALDLVRRPSGSRFNN